MSSAKQILDALRSQNKKLVLAESVTGGLLTAEFAKVAAQMAEGIRNKISQKLGLELGSLVAISTTGVAGPAEQDGKPVGELYICVSHGPEEAVSSNVFAHQLAGDRAQIQNSAVLLGLGHLWEEIAE